VRPKKVILVAGEVELDLSVLKFTLETNGYRVLAASNGQEAIAIFATAPRIDLVVVDAAMPQMSGIQLAERLKRMRSCVPVLMLGEAPEEWPSVCVDAVLVKKTMSPVVLLERVKVMSARKRGPRKGTLRNDVCAVPSDQETMLQAV
jgi:CheY-like chemotaxis protein